MHSLAPRKGTIAVGSDADITLWDPTRTTTIANDRLHHNVDFTTYEGREITGWPMKTLSRGELVWDDGKALAEPGRGEFLARETPEPVLRHTRPTTTH
tara:strand:- start:5142 stop:5435 length:294 start_codon:yes stop_codon:yes gene_type:complete